MQIEAKVKRSPSSGLWPWSASAWIGHDLFYEISMTRAGALRRLRKAIRQARKPSSPPAEEIVRLEVD